MKQILKAAWYTPGLGGRVGLPILFRGAPGVGKSSQMGQIAAECGLHCETVLASIREPADFLGLPIPVRNEADRDQAVQWMRESAPRAEPRAQGNRLVFQAVTYAPPRWAVNLARAGEGVGFMDEISSCPPSIQAALLRVILEGVVGDLHLPATVRWVAAANPTETAAGGWDLAAPLANRFGHLQWPAPSADGWASHMMAPAAPEAGNVAELQHRAEEVWRDHYPSAVGTVAAFLRARPNLLLAQPNPGDPRASEAWPSPRSWSMATHAWAGALAHGLAPQDREQLIAAFVGASAMAEICAFAENLDLPNPARLLDGEVAWKHQAVRMDRTVAVLSSVAALLVSGGPKAPKARARGEAAWKIFREVCVDSVDLVVEPARALFNAKFSTAGADAAFVSKKMYPLVDAASRHGAQ